MEPVSHLVFLSFTDLSDTGADAATLKMYLISTRVAMYISYRYNIKHLYNIQIQKYIANKKIIQNYAQRKYKLPVAAIKSSSL